MFCNRLSYAHNSYCIRLALKPPKIVETTKGS